MTEQMDSAVGALNVQILQSSASERETSPHDEGGGDSTETQMLTPPPPPPLQVC